MDVNWTGREDMRIGGEWTVYKLNWNSPELRGI